MDQIEKVKFFAVSGFLVLALAIVVVHNNNQKPVRIEAGTDCSQHEDRLSCSNDPNCQVYPLNNIQGGSCSGVTKGAPESYCSKFSEATRKRCNSIKNEADCRAKSDPISSDACSWNNNNSEGYKCDSGYALQNCGFYGVCSIVNGVCVSNGGENCSRFNKVRCNELKGYGCSWTEEQNFKCGDIDPITRHRRNCAMINSIDASAPDICKKCLSQTSDSCAFADNTGVITDSGNCTNAVQGECFYNPNQNSYRSASFTSPNSRSPSSQDTATPSWSPTWTPSDRGGINTGTGGATGPGIQTTNSPSGVGGNTTNTYGSAAPLRGPMDYEILTGENLQPCGNGSPRNYLFVPQNGNVPSKCYSNTISGGYQTIFNYLPDEQTCKQFACGHMIISY